MKIETVPGLTALPTAGAVSESGQSDEVQYLTGWSDGFIHKRNLHLLWAEYLRPLHELCVTMGGLNSHNQPVYRLVYGWQYPEYYIPKQRDFFHLQRWVNVADMVTEELWDWNERIEEQREPLYKKQPFPRHGEYFNVRTCRWGKPVSPVPLFRRPDETWVSGAIIANKIQRARLASEIRKDVKETREFVKQAQQEKAAKVADDLGVREIFEDYADLLIGNPTLRSDPSLFLSPAVAYKRTRNAIHSNL